MGILNILNHILYDLVYLESPSRELLCIIEILLGLKYFEFTIYNPALKITLLEQFLAN